MKNSNEHLIRWKKGDYIKLGQAVSNFNKKIKALQVDEREYLPDLRDYKELKDEIYSRKELNRVINSLKSFSKKGAEDIYTTEAGEELTKWEFREITKARNRAIKSLTLEKEEILAGRKSIGMGDERLASIEGTISSFENLKTKKGYEFKRVKERVLSLGETDKKLKQASVYRENFLKSLEEVKNFQNYDKLMNVLNKIKNPIKFFEFIKKSNTFSDLYIWYKEEAERQKGNKKLSSGGITYGSFSSSEEMFNYGLEELGIEYE